MKPFVKFCVILSAALAVIGVGGVGVGMAMGARPAQFLNLSDYEYSILRRCGRWADRWDERTEEWMEEREEEIDEQMDSLDEQMDSLDEQLDSLDEEWSDWEDWGYSDSLEVISGNSADTFEGDFADEDVKRLEMDLHYAVVRIYTREDSDAVSLKGRNGREYFSSRMEGDTLVLKDMRTEKQYRQDKALELEVYLPAWELEEIELDTGASDVTADFLQAREIELDSGMGYLKAEQLKGDEIFVSQGAGMTEIGSMTAEGKAKIEVGVGSVAVNEFTGDSLQLDCGIGEIDLTVQGQQDEYNYKLSCGMGEVQIGEEQYSSIKGEKSIDNQAAKNISADCGVGEIFVNFQS